MDFCAPRYIVYKETCVRKMIKGWSNGALKYERKIDAQKEERLTRLYLEEKNEEGGKELYSKEREKFFNSLDFSIVVVKDMKIRDIVIENIIEKRRNDIENKIIHARIRDTRYNPRYREIAVEGLPKYLREENKDYVIFVRIKYRNCERGNTYWLGEKDLICRLCNNGRDSIKLWIEDCVIAKEW